MGNETKLTDMNILGPFISENLKNNNQVKLTVTGNSMYPLLKSRVDTVILNAPKKIKKYDIVFYKRDNGQYILHRILNIKGENLCIAGDNEVNKEFPVRKDQVIGVVCGFYRKEKYHSVKELFFRFYGWFWCSIFPIRYIVLRMSIKIYSKILKIKKENNIAN